MIINTFKNKISPLNNLGDFPQYDLEEDIPPRSESFSHSDKDIPDLETKESAPS